MLHYISSVGEILEVRAVGYKDIHEGAPLINNLYSAWLVCKSGIDSTNPQTIIQ